MSKKYALLAFTTALFSAASLTAAAASPASQCAALKKYNNDGFTILSSKYVKAGPVPAAPAVFEGATTLPAHCLVSGSLGKRVGLGENGENRPYEIRFELRMPTDWNGRFLFEGGGVMDGVDWPAYGTLFELLSPNALSRGFAVVRTNSGHTSPNQNSSDGSFSYDQQAKIDYAFNALDKVTLSAKDIVAHYYGKPADHNYFMGCSNGGRQAMLVSQKFPEYFDGVVSGHASFYISRLAPRLVWNVKVLSEISPKDENGKAILSKAYSLKDLELLDKSVLEQCDSLDGLQDGMINDIAGCNFNPKSLVCENEKTDTCLTQEQVTTLDKIMQGPLDHNGKPLYALIPYDNGFATSWRHSFLGTSESSNGNGAMETLALDTYRYHSLTPPNPDFDPLDIDVEKALVDVRETQSLNDAEAAYMNTFAKHSKLLMYHGVSDFMLSTREITGWYDKAQNINAGDIHDWARLFIVPGMTHCGGGNATDKIDPLNAIVDWVENDKAPEFLLGKGKAFPGVTRPVCAWPEFAHYKGGPENEASSFVCE